MPLDELLADEMQSARRTLNAVPDSPRRRELRVRSGTYERALTNCRHLEAGQAQESMLCELISELRVETEALREATIASATPVPRARFAESFVFNGVLGLRRQAMGMRGEVRE